MKWFIRNALTLGLAVSASLNSITFPLIQFLSGTFYVLFLLLMEAVKIYQENHDVALYVLLRGRERRKRHRIHPNVTGLASLADRPSYEMSMASMANLGMASLAKLPSKQMSLSCIMLHPEWTGLLDKLNLNGQQSKSFVNMIRTFTTNILMFIILRQKLAISSTSDNATSVYEKFGGGFKLNDASSSTGHTSNVAVPIVTKFLRSKKRNSLFSVFDTPFSDEEVFNNHMSLFQADILHDNSNYCFEAKCG